VFLRNGLLLSHTNLKAFQKGFGEVGSQPRTQSIPWNIALAENSICLVAGVELPIGEMQKEFE
jgi:hypothetical protein